MRRGCLGDGRKLKKRLLASIRLRSCKESFEILGCFDSRVCCWKEFLFSCFARFRLPKRSRFIYDQDWLAHPHQRTSCNLTIHLFSKFERFFFIQTLFLTHVCKRHLFFIREEKSFYRCPTHCHEDALPRTTHIHCSYTMHHLLPDLRLLLVSSSIFPSSLDHVRILWTFFLLIQAFSFRTSWSPINFTFVIVRSSVFSYCSFLPSFRYLRLGHRACLSPLTKVLLRLSTTCMLFCHSSCLCSHIFISCRSSPLVCIAMSFISESYPFVNVLVLDTRLF
jgi:hypothetical protein